MCKRHGLLGGIRQCLTSSRMPCPGMQNPEPGTQKLDRRRGGNCERSECSMPSYEEVQERIRTRPRTWLVTGVAGFIGSNLLEALLNLNPQAIGVDNLFTGRRAKLTQVKDAVSESQWRKFRFVEGDIRSLDTCRAVCGPADIVL